MRPYLLLCLLVTGLAALAQWTTPLVPKNGGADSDGTHYLAMAGDTAQPPVEGRIAPFCNRVATPWVASRLPCARPLDRFRALAFIDACLVLFLAFAMLRAFGLGHRAALVGMVLYAGVFWSVRFSLYSPAYIDHMTQVFWLLLLWVMARGWWWLLPVVLFAACFQKESMPAIVPVVMVYYLHRRGWRWWPLYLLGFLLVAASVVPWLILRNNVHPVNVTDPAEALSKAWEFAVHTEGFARIMVVATFSGLGMLPLVLLGRFGWVLATLRRQPHWVALLAVGVFLLFGGRDKARLFIYMLPAMVYLATACLHQMRRWMPPLPFALWFVSLLALHAYVGGWFADLADFDHYLDTLVPEYSGTGGSRGFARALLASGLFLLAGFLWLGPHRGREAVQNEA